MNSTFAVSNYQTIIQKTIRLQNQSSPHQDLIKVFFQYLPGTRQINLSKAMNELASNGFPIQNSQLFYWSYDRKMFVYIGNYPFKDEYFLKYQNFQQNIIHIRYRKIVYQAQHRNNCTKSDRQITNKHSSRIPNVNQKSQKRVKQRSIQDVIKLVSKWRYLYQKLDSNGKRIHTLQSAARQVGISKKTLDDYYLQLKYGQAYNFDFEYNKYAKIGTLRSFVRQFNKGPRKLYQKLKFLTKCNPQLGHAPSNNQMMQSRENSIHSGSQINGGSDQESQAYLFHKQHSCQFSDDDIC